MTIQPSTTTKRKTNKRWYYYEEHGYYFKLIDGVLWSAHELTNVRNRDALMEVVDWNSIQNEEPFFGKFASLAEELLCTVVPDLKAKE